MKIEKCGNITLINGDCMEFMQSQSDKSFDLAIVDPPYGIDYAAKPARSKHEKKNWDKVKVQSKKKRYTPHKNQ